MFNYNKVLNIFFTVVGTTQRASEISGYKKLTQYSLTMSPCHSLNFQSFFLYFDLLVKQGLTVHLFYI